MDRTRAFLAIAAAVGLAFGGCSVVNAPVDVDPVGAGAGNTGAANPGGSNPGGGGSGTGGTGMGGTGTGGTDVPECDGPDDCVDLTTECSEGVCQGGYCVAEHHPADTPCGNQEESECTLPDACDGEGHCDPRDAEDTPCNDCPAGAGLCSVCDSAVCEDWTT